MSRKSIVWCKNRSGQKLEDALKDYIERMMQSQDVETVKRQDAIYTKGNLEQEAALDLSIQRLVQRVRNDGLFRSSFGRCRYGQASHEETVDIELKIKYFILEKLPNYREKLYGPFRALMIPLSGVNHNCVLKKGDQLINIIGESHQHNFCKEKKYTPISEILPTFLKNSVEPIDFMIEMPNMSVYPLHEQDHISKLSFDMSRQPVNNTMKGFDSPLSIINLVRNLVRPLIPTKTYSPPVTFPNARVHWLDGHVEQEKLNHLFMILCEKIIEHNYADAYDVRSAINKMLVASGFTPKWYLDDGSDTDENKRFLMSTDADKLDFFKACYDAFRTSKIFRKCYGVISSDRKTPASWEIYRDVFWSHVRKYNLSINHFYFLVQRFFMDIYTCCRIIKQDPRWFKNIVIYVGYEHLKRLVDILSKMGYERYYIPAKYNPICDPSLAGGRK